MDINAVAKKIRQAVMDSAEDQGRTFNASSLDDVIARELRLHWPVAPIAPASYPWAVVPMAGSSAVLSEAMWDGLMTGASLTITHIPDEEWR